MAETGGQEANQDGENDATQLPEVTTKEAMSVRFTTVELRAKQLALNAKTTGLETGAAMHKRGAINTLLNELDGCAYMEPSSQSVKPST